MNIKQSINHRDNKCPFCNTELTVKFYPIYHNQTLKFHDDLLEIKFDSENFPYQVNYNINTDNNYVVIKFFESNQEILPNENIMEEFISFFSNDNCFITKDCSNCNRYYLHTNFFKIKDKQTINLIIDEEEFSFIVPISENKSKILLLVNCITDNCSQLFIWDGYGKFKSIYDHFESEKRKIDLPLIPFISVQKTQSRLLKLLAFI